MIDTVANEKPQPPAKRTWLFLLFGEIERFSLRTLMASILSLAAAYGIYLHSNRWLKLGLAACVIAMLLISYIAGLVARLRDIPWLRQRTMTTGIVLSFTMLGLVMGFGHTVFKMERENKIAGSVVDGLTQYALDHHGAYPKTLDELPEAYLNRADLLAARGLIVYEPQTGSERGLVIYSIESLFDAPREKKIELVYFPPERKTGE